MNEKGNLMLSETTHRDLIIVLLIVFIVLAGLIGGIIYFIFTLIKLG
jgi:hypothetical protein